MTPPEALIRRMGVEWGVTVEVMVPMAAHPFQGISLNCQHTAVGECILQPLGGGEGSVTELSVEAKGDAQAAGDEIHAEKEGHHWP